MSFDEQAYNDFLRKEIRALEAAGTPHALLTEAHDRFDANPDFAPRIYLDVETVGFHGPIVLVQYAIEDGPIQMHTVWNTPVIETLALLRQLCAFTVVGFNLTFDWFHVCQMYTTLVEYVNTGGDPYEPPDVEHYAASEPAARDRNCLKPYSAIDVFLWARKTKYQTLMERKMILLRRVPNEAVPTICKALNDRLPFAPIYFERRKRKGLPVWQAKPSEKEGFSDVYVSFRPSSRLKSLAKDALALKDDPLNIDDLGLPDYAQPIELGYAPFALAVTKLTSWTGKNEKMFFGKWKGSWPAVIKYHISHWTYNELARKYAADDIEYTRGLYKYFGEPEHGDDDSVLACAVGAMRWRGFRVDLDRIQSIKEDAINIAGQIPTDAGACTRWLAAGLAIDDPSGILELTLPDSTKKTALVELIKWDEATAAHYQKINDAKLDPVARRKALDELPWGYEASRRAALILEARHAGKRIELCNKLLIAERFHVSNKIIGTLSSRMSGADKLNAQAINKVKYIREAFPLAWPGQELEGGDFDSFEIVIAVAYYNDPKLEAAIQETIECVFCDGKGCKECKGTGKEKKKIHAIFGSFLFKPKTYKEIRMSSGQVPDLYTISKSGVFTWLYAGTERSFEDRLGISAEIAAEGIADFEQHFSVVGAKRRALMDAFSAYEQPDGPGTKVLRKVAETEISTLLGFKRYFTLEIEAINGLADLMESLPRALRDNDIFVSRYDTEQHLSGAVQSCLLGAMRTVQGQVQRAAINLPIQGTGGQATKYLQRRLWDIQQPGYKPWVVMPVNFHDEIMCPTDPLFASVVQQTVSDTIEEMRTIIPLLAMAWHGNLSSWAAK